MSVPAAGSAASVSRRSYVALVHHPVYDKQQQVVSTAVTNLDIHDIARSCCTYGLAGYYVVHPVAAQRQLVERILGYWDEGPGQNQNDFRREALSHVRVVAAMDEAVDAIHKEHGMRPLVVGTTARPSVSAVAAPQLRAELEQSARPLLLVMGTGWGLTNEFMSQVDRVLEPIQGRAPYNHLSVRSATAIMLDRLFAEEAGT
jgi:hypothetical protein